MYSTNVHNAGLQKCFFSTMKTHFLQQPYEYDDYPWFSKVTNAE